MIISLADGDGAGPSTLSRPVTERLTAEGPPVERLDRYGTEHTAYGIAHRPDRTWVEPVVGAVEAVVRRTAAARPTEVADTEAVLP
ncbi:hypothetical protein ACIHAA_04715 [Streptomyces sp. NPDC052040]|uniref:hypothetical protein n=1 Tax=unclassified Streptomyces TaxID=2593676 RepID=UPI0037D8E0E3